MKAPWMPAQRRIAALVACLVWALVWWLDSDASGLALRPAGPVHTAHVFLFIWSGIQALAGLLAAGAEIAVSYLAAALSWLAGRVATILTGTGAIFAKVWDGLKIVWSDVLRPTLLWVDDKLKAAYAWMKSTFKPVFDFLNDVRRRLNDFYATFVKPVVDTIEFIRAINQALLAFHITVLQGLDAWLQQLEQRITEPFQWVYAKLNEVQGWLDKIVTGDGFFQRLTLLRSMGRYAPAWMNYFWAQQLANRPPARDPYDANRDYPTHEVVEDVNALTDYFTDGTGDRAAVIRELGLMFVHAAGTVAHSEPAIT